MIDNDDSKDTHLDKSRFCMYKMNITIAISSFPPPSNDIAWRHQGILEVRTRKELHKSANDPENANDSEAGPIIITGEEVFPANDTVKN